ncbi:MAG: gluconate 2-dehydrogenase subunit 3 family protein [Bacteroidota bacterium]
MNERGLAHMLTRREALQRFGVITGGALSAPLVSGLLAGCRATPVNETFVPQTLSGAQYELVGTLAEIIIPTTDTPGARAAGVPAFIDQMLTSWYLETDRDDFLAGLQLLDEIAQSRFGSTFIAAGPENQHALLTATAQLAFPEEVAAASADDLPDTLGPFFRELKQLVVVGYYTSETGATEELLQPRMGIYRGDIPYDEIGRAWS